MRAHLSASRLLLGPFCLVALAISGCPTTEADPPNGDVAAEAAIGADVSEDLANEVGPEQDAVPDTSDVSGSDVSGSDVSGSDVSGSDVSGSDVSGSDVSAIDASDIDGSGVLDTGTPETTLDAGPDIIGDIGSETDATDAGGDAGLPDVGLEVEDASPDQTPEVDTNDAGPPSDIGPEADVPQLMCPQAPPGTPVEAAAALDLANSYRSAMGIPCATLDGAISQAAKLHCDYYAANSGACVANAHKEVSGCSLYVAANFWERMSAAGYGGSAVFENMAFSNDGASATQQWIDSVWHRTPVLSPWVRHVGYGGAQGCDTMDFGRGPSTPDDAVGVYPFDGQTAVPVSFNGLYEGPTPPAPPTGWPSGYVVHVYARDATITSHSIEVEGSGQPLDHIWISPNDSQFLSDEHVMYPHQPMASQTTYRVTVSGSYAGGTLDLSWTFTTE